ncbi:MAG: hydrogenase expression/formation protein HypD [Blastocatellia bacterium]|jgi:hydrogenase expression/formation protein HypD|nr:hydrogenase expression/formation protein HypD [Blastocatellia bacterium]
MKFIDEYRQGDIAHKLAEQIARLTARPLKIMEVCGGHTHTIFKYGIEDLLPDNITMIHGPGCPVCVIPLGRVDDAISIAEQPGVIFTTFGDAMRVPGSKTSLLDAKASGADVRMVYSPLDALKIAKKNPERQVVWLALGFETTAPSTAMTILQAAKEGVENFSAFCNHITIVPALKALLDSPDLQLDGFLGPGHVSTVIGTRPYEFVPREYGKPVAVAGFEPLDILQSIYMIVRQVVEGRAEVENQYARCINRDGNRKALEVLFEVFEPRDYFEWRGLGSIAHSGMKLRRKYAAFDAELKFNVPGLRIADPKACQCGEILKGVKRPWECKVFGTACTPETPIGSCMVSSEGACAAYYNFGRLSKIAERSSSNGEGKVAAAALNVTV